MTSADVLDVSSLIPDVSSLILDVCYLLLFLNEVGKSKGIR